MRFAKSLLLACILVCVAVESSFPGKCLAATTALKLKVTHKGFGNSAVYVNNRGIRMHFVDSGGDIVSAAPSWDVVFFNRRDKVMHKITLKHWKERGFSSLPEPRPAPLTPADVVTRAPWNGIDCNRVRVMVNRVVNRRTFSSNFAEEKTTKSRVKKYRDYFYLHEGKFPMQLCAVLGTLYDFPEGPGLPIAEEDTFGGGLKFHLMQTTSVERIPASAVDLSIPSGLRVTKNMYEGLYGNGRLKYFAEWMGGIGVGEKE